MYNSDIIKSIEYLDRGEETLICVIAYERTYCNCILDGVTYDEIANKCEPFDFRVHLFTLPTSTLEKVGSFELQQKQKSKKSEEIFRQNSRWNALSTVLCAFHIAAAACFRGRLSAEMPTAECAPSPAAGIIGYAAMR